MNSAQTFLISTLIFLLALSATPVFAGQSRSANEKKTQAFYETIRSNPLTLRGFVSGMPKGGDLRVRLRESIYPEDYLQLAQKENYCITLPTYYAVPPLRGVCPPGTASAKKFFESEENYLTAINRLSTASFNSKQNFFSLDNITPDQFGFLLGAVVENAVYQHLDYLEVLMPWFPPKLKKRAANTDWKGTTKQMYAALSPIAAMESIEKEKARFNSLMAGTQNYLPTQQDKSVLVRMIASVDRTQPPSVVFTQLIYAFKTVVADPHFVGVALTGDEDHPIALRDYALQIEMLNFLKNMKEFSNVETIITAGYLDFGRVQPTQFKNRIRMAVTKGNATRISHGSAIMYENNPFELLKTLSEQKIPVEIALTSEETVRSISATDNPFPVLNQYNVPVVVVTESGGLTRIDITNEYTRAAHDYNLSYTDLKTLIRNSLEYSLLPGKSLWKNTTPYIMGDECSDSLTNKETGICQKLLTESPKARMQWDLETEFVEFERKFSSQ
ncbi:amidohydrolase family protein [Halodesulfovibrio marinisediminis]|uniref:Adenosine deaminase n=1 Tax=Halodesulfovibrio marinisediminis DSM 17456 TaxID=1121457 RepID=A0A1N6DIV8_9BACT|nr:hypothetical protein [Halodesulfovibrio marinisediminis]SIN70688.1 adenosine deaminase [Halodesulfovibrio marinisediminis DSM 17456]